MQAGSCCATDAPCDRSPVTVPYVCGGVQGTWPDAGQGYGAVEQTSLACDTDGRYEGYKRLVAKWWHRNWSNISICYHHCATRVLTSTQQTAARESVASVGIVGFPFCRISGEDIAGLYSTLESTFPHIEQTSLYSFHLRTDDQIRSL